MGTSPGELDKFLRGELDRWTPIIKTLGLKAD
jgi:hypothetical protein